MLLPVVGQAELAMQFRRDARAGAGSAAGLDEVVFTGDGGPVQPRHGHEAANKINVLQPLHEVLDGPHGVRPHLQHIYQCALGRMETPADQRKTLRRGGFLMLDTPVRRLGLIHRRAGNRRIEPEVLKRRQGVYAVQVFGEVIRQPLVSDGWDAVGRLASQGTEQALLGRHAFRIQRAVGIIQSPHFRPNVSADVVCSVRSQPP